MARDDISSLSGENGEASGESAAEVGIMRAKTIELAAAAPPEFKEKRRYYYYLTYAGMANGEPVFTSDSDGESLLGRLLDRLVNFVQAEKPLEIKIGRSALVTIETVGDVYWSTQWSAIMTLDDHQDLYGQLEYFDDRGWIPRAQVNANYLYRRIRFKAKRKGFVIPDFHGFSYNVKYRAADSTLQEYEIDPDIKNPSM